MQILFVFNISHLLLNLVKSMLIKCTPYYHKYVFTYMSIGKTFQIEMKKTCMNQLHSNLNLFKFIDRWNMHLYSQVNN